MIDIGDRDRVMETDEVAVVEVWAREETSDISSKLVTYTMTFTYFYFEVCLGEAEYDSIIFSRRDIHPMYTTRSQHPVFD
jgi:hypothetical protein